MKRTPFIIVLILSFIIEILLCTAIISRIMMNPGGESGVDTVLVNECVKSVEENFGNEALYRDSLKYSVIDNEGKLLYKNAEGLSTSINEAVKNSDVILDVTTDEGNVGKILIHNNMTEVLRQAKKNLMTVLVIASVLQVLIIISFYFYLNRTIISPFKKLNGFAVRVAEGNLDIPLEIDRGHIFGSFTEGFDLMRSELKKARAAEKKANDDKKEVIAKLSHDIKTPIASIKSSSEFGFELTGEERTKEIFGQINAKADQITALADNLFHSSIEDVTEIEVNPSRYESGEVASIIKNADYLNRAGAFNVPDCFVYIDRLRLQQAFDNIFMNSYKYADTDIEVNAFRDGDYLVIRVADHGEGVSPDEIPLLKEKYKRGSNTKEKEGAGLGLYLTDHFINRMNGKLVIERPEKGFSVLVFLRLV